MTDTALPFQTARSQLLALRERRISATELLQLTLARIARHDAQLNAVAVLDAEPARRAAAAADARLAQGPQADLPALLGLPVTVKEAFNLSGLPTTWGIPGTEKIPVTQDAVLVQRLRQAGAVIVGKTNVPSQLADWQTDNPVYGRTANPWDVSRTPGGSSGGSAAALAAGYVALEFGTDLWGSLRVPAHCCGVWAHKPSHGLVPMRGSAPPGTPQLSVPAEVDLAVAGPMARSAADLALALDVVAGPDDALATAYTLRLPPPRHAQLAGHRVLVLSQHPAVPTSAAVAGAIEALAVRLTQAGCQVAHGPQRLAGLPAAVPDLALIGRIGTQLLMGFVGADLPPADHAALSQQVQALAADDASPQAQEWRALVASHRDWVAADRARAFIRHAWRQLFQQWDVVICPVLPTTAFAHDARPMAERLLDIDGQAVPYGLQGAWSALASVAGLPATAMPIGHDAQGLPIGVQAIGPWLEDRTPIHFGSLVEQAFGGFVPPPAMA